MRETVRTLVDLGQLPTDTELDEATAKRFAEAFSAVDRPSADEAAALVALLPPDSSTSFGLAWTLVHLIESSPTWTSGYSGGLDAAPTDARCSVHRRLSSASQRKFGQ